MYVIHQQLFCHLSHLLKSFDNLQKLFQSIFFFIFFILLIFYISTVTKSWSNLFALLSKYLKACFVDTRKVNSREIVERIGFVQNFFTLNSNDRHKNYCFYWRDHWNFYFFSYNTSAIWSMSAGSIAVIEKQESLS